MSNRASGVVYEKRLIEQYINEHATEPSSGEALTTDDLLPIKSSRIVRPRPPTLTSIPALLATFQNEWDALALETYNLKEQLARAREELATALYQHDAAVRVIARLSKERDEARDSLSKVTISGADGAANGEEMVVDSVEALPEELAAQVDETHQTWVPRRCAVVDGFTDTFPVYPRAERSERTLKAGSLPPRSLRLNPRPRTHSPCRKRPRSICRARRLPLVASTGRRLSTRSRRTSWRARSPWASR